MRKVNNSQAVCVDGILWLWDTGASHWVISRHYVKKFWKYFRQNEIIYEAAGGNCKTKYYINIDFILPEFSETRIINHKFHIDSSKYNTLGFYMIKEQYLMKKLVMIVGFNSKNSIWVIWRSWDNCLKPTLSRDKINQVMQHTAEPKVIRESTEVILKILDSKYKKSNLKEISQSEHQLNTK